MLLESCSYIAPSVALLDQVRFDDRAFETIVIISQ